MEQKKSKITNVFLAFLVPIGLAIFWWAFSGLEPARIDFRLPVLCILTLIFGSYLRVQLPRTKIHLTLSDTLIFVTFLLYGAQFAIILGAVEAFTSSAHFRRKGTPMSARTVLINILVSELSVASMVVAVTLVFGDPGASIAHLPIKQVAMLLGSMALAQFLVNSVLVSGFISIRSGETLWHVWNEYCLNALVIYMTGAFMAGVVYAAITQIEPFLLVLVGLFFCIVYFTYVRYVNDVKRSSALAEQAERDRAEEAETHIGELQHYVTELEKSADALRESRERFRHAAYHDALTGLANRYQFTELLVPYLASESKPEGEQFALLFLDLNRFKTVNDSLGHSIGDELIKSVGERLKKSVGEDGVAGRLSGDEFVILVPSRSEAEALEFAELVSDRVSAPYSLGGRQIFTSVSIGIAMASPRYKSPDELLRDADIAMYYAKENGKKFVVFDQIMHARAVSLLELETDLRLGLERDEFELFYQPLVDLSDMRLIGFEALVRWNHPSRGLVTPGEFISVAESTGLIIPMTVQLLRKACKRAASWIADGIGPSDLVISVNISVGHLEQASLVEDLKTILAETNLRPSCLKLEITESAVMENAESAIALLGEIKALGVHLSIDDFGTGYSSLSYLHCFPIDTLKVDRSFVKAMNEGSGTGAIVKTVLALANALELSVIAEGIETLSQFERLRDLGCEYGQGFLFSRPVPVDEAEALMRSRVGWKGLSMTVPEYALPESFGSVEHAGIH